MNKRVKVFLWWTVLIVVLILFAIYVISHPNTQWDIQSYYYGGLSHKLGLNPYLPETFKQLSPNKGVFPFLYPPYTLKLFAQISSVGINYLLFWIPITKVIASILLIYIWIHFFLKDEYNQLSLFIILFGISCAYYVDFVSGNITIFLELLFWGGLASLLKRKYYMGVLLIGISALFKLTPLIILIPIYFFFKQTRKQVVWIMAIFLVIVAYSYYSNPEIFISYLKSSLEAVLPPAPNFSTWSLWHGVSQLAPSSIQNIVRYVGISFTLILSTYYAWKQLHEQRVISVRNIMTCLAWYLIVTPRMHFYYFITLIPIILYLLFRNKITSAVLGLVFIALILPETVNFLQPPYFSLLVPVLKTYSQTLLLIAACFGFLHQSSSSKEKNTLQP